MPCLGVRSSDFDDLRGFPAIFRYSASTHAPLLLLEAKALSGDGTSASGDWSKVSFTECSCICSGWKTGPQGRYVDLPFARMRELLPLQGKE